MVFAESDVKSVCDMLQSNGAANRDLINIREIKKIQILNNLFQFELYFLPSRQQTFTQSNSTIFSIYS